MTLNLLVRGLNFASAFEQKAKADFAFSGSAFHFCPDSFRADFALAKPNSAFARALFIFAQNVLEQNFA